MVLPLDSMEQLTDFDSRIVSILNGELEDYVNENFSSLIKMKFE